MDDPVGEIEHQPLNAIGEEGDLIDSTCADLEIEHVGDCILDHEVGLVGELTVLGPEHPTEITRRLVADDDSAVTNLQEDRRPRTDDRPEDGAGVVA